MINLQVNFWISCSDISSAPFVYDHYFQNDLLCYLHSFPHYNLSLFPRAFHLNQYDSIFFFLAGNKDNA